MSALLPQSKDLDEFMQNGKVLSREQKNDRAKRKGLCPRCGIKTHKIRLARTPITDKDVYKGHCIKCDPDNVPLEICIEWEMKNPTQIPWAKRTRMHTHRGVQRDAHQQLHHGLRASHHHHSDNHHHQTRGGPERGHEQEKSGRVSTPVLRTRTCSSSEGTDGAAAEKHSSSDHSDPEYYHQHYHNNQYHHTQHRYSRGGEGKHRPVTSASANAMNAPCRSNNSSGRTDPTEKQSLSSHSDHNELKNNGALPLEACCHKCGMQTHKEVTVKKSGGILQRKSKTRLEPLTIDGAILNGRCLICFPLPNNDGAILRPPSPDSMASAERAGDHAIPFSPQRRLTVPTYNTTMPTSSSHSPRSSLPTSSKQVLRRFSAPTHRGLPKKEEPSGLPPHEPLSSNKYSMFEQQLSPENDSLPSPVAFTMADEIAIIKNSIPQPRRRKQRSSDSIPFSNQAIVFNDQQLQVVGEERVDTDKATAGERQRQLAEGTDTNKIVIPVPPWKDHSAPHHGSSRNHSPPLRQQEYHDDDDDDDDDDKYASELQQMNGEQTVGTVSPRDEEDEFVATSPHASRPVATAAAPTSTMRHLRSSLSRDPPGDPPGDRHLSAESVLMTGNKVTVAHSDRRRNTGSTIIDGSAISC